MQLDIFQSVSATWKKSLFYSLPELQLQHHGFKTLPIMQTRTAADTWTIGPPQYWLLQKCLLNCYLKSHHLLFIQQIERTLWDLNLDPRLRHCKGTICFIVESLSLRFLEQNSDLVLVPRTKLTQSKSSFLLILRGF